MSEFAQPDVGVTPLQRAAGRHAPWLWGAFLVVASAAGSLVLACVAPFVAVATIATLSLELPAALAVAATAWLANQAVGFGLLAYPWTLETAAWGLAIGLGTVLAAAVAAHALARRRQTARAELYRRLDHASGPPTSWGLRLFNGHGEQQITILLPNPFLSPDGEKVLTVPDWSRLALWDEPGAITSRSGEAAIAP